MQVMRQVARHIGEQHVIGDVGGNHQTNTCQQAAPVPGRNLFKRHLRTVLQSLTIALLQFIHVLLERRSLFQCMTQVQANKP